ncbi:FHA domain-containing protein [Thiorhodococcus mannitoliphagus]|uniref:FHA domain-containing protein n=1 Tax=Thiorhodococcus mannitoliphagus TaxID=329406 RepID=A0A6P1E0Q7_9GAMM|nr:FHA domain-containing protein [Thiorhodococcus mannitoliphagus]NEX22052.1 FHA domain-containing protein [Thiorhodococcus mannitoliphagus]
MAKSELSTQSRIASIGKLNYLDFYGLSAPPFRNNSEVEQPYLSDALGTALAQIEAVLAGAQGGALVVNGAPGSGKTTLVNHVIDRLDDAIRIVKINRTMLAENDFLQILLHGLDLDPEGLDKRLMIESFLEAVDAENAAGRPLVLVIDEAQNLKPEILKLLPSLFQQEDAEGRATLRHLFVVLIGQDGFEHTLAHSGLEKVQRLVLFQTYLRPLAQADTSAYIDYQIFHVAQAERNPFSERAMSRIHMLTGGSIRLINTLCDFVLFNACLGQIRRITPELVQTTFNALQWETPRNPARNGSDQTNGESQRSRLILEFNRDLELPIDKETITIGRSSDNDICIRDLRVSRYHAKLSQTEQGLRIEDLKSTNGVYVNNERVQSRVLADGDAIAIDQNRMRLILAGAAKKSA